MEANAVCVVRGEVLRSFRGLPPAARDIELEIECKPRGEGSPPGDEFRLDLEDLSPGRMVEAFIDRAFVDEAVRILDESFAATPLA